MRRRKTLALDDLLVVAEMEKAMLSMDWLRWLSFSLHVHACARLLGWADSYTTKFVQGIINASREGQVGLQVKGKRLDLGEPYRPELEQLVHPVLRAFMRGP